MGYFGEIVTAMITPFKDNGDVDFVEAVKLANYLVENGTDTILLAGTTGESPTLTHKEERQLFTKVKKNLPKHNTVMAGTGSNCTVTAIKATQDAERLGVDSVLQVVPYYNKPCQEGMYQHFKAISESTSLPIMLYNIPGRTGKNMEPETISRLSQLKNIVAVKEAAGSIEQVKAISKLIDTDFDIYSGDDGLTLDFMEHGAKGVVSVASHCVGTQIKDMIQSFLAGQKKEAREIEKTLSQLFETLFITSNPAPLKAALKLMGFNVGGLRLPLVEVNENEFNQVKSALEALNLISVTA